MLHTPSTIITLACIIVGWYSYTSTSCESSQSYFARLAYFTMRESVRSPSVRIRTCTPRLTA